MAVSDDFLLHFNGLLIIEIIQKVDSRTLSLSSLSPRKKDFKIK